MSSRLDQTVPIGEITRLEHRFSYASMTTVPGFLPATNRPKGQPFSGPASFSFGASPVVTFADEKSQSFIICVEVDQGLEWLTAGPKPTADEVAWERAANEVRLNPSLRANIIESVSSSMAFEGFHITQARAEQLLDKALMGPPLVFTRE